MELDRVALLVKRLAEKSAAGEIEWDATSNTGYSAEVGSYRVTIYEHDEGREPWDDPDYSLSISNLTGGVWIDSFSDVELKDVMTGAFKVMQKLYRDARRQARNVGSVIDDLLRDIGGDA